MSRESAGWRDSWVKANFYLRDVLFKANKHISAYQEKLVATSSSTGSSAYAQPLSSSPWCSRYRVSQKNALSESSLLSCKLTPQRYQILAPSFFEKVQIERSGGPEFWVIWKVGDPQDLIFKTQDLWFQPLIEVLSLHCPPILNFPCAGIPESPKMYQPRQNHHIPQMNKNSSYVKKI